MYACDRRQPSVNLAQGTFCFTLWAQWNLSLGQIDLGYSPLTAVQTTVFCLCLLVLWRHNHMTLGGPLNVMKPSHQYHEYRDFHVRDKKTVKTALSLTWKSPYLKRWSLYWDRAQVAIRDRFYSMCFWSLWLTGNLLCINVITVGLVLLMIIVVKVERSRVELDVQGRVARM